MKPHLNITAKLTLLFVLFAALLLAGVGLLAYNSGRAALEAATISDLLSTAIEKEAALNAWVEDRQLDITALTHSPDLLEDVTTLAATTPGSAEAQAARDRVVRELQTWAGPGQQYLTLLVIEAETGRVIAATDPIKEGKFKEDRPYFINGKNGPYVQNVYYPLDSQEPAMTAAAPLRPAGGRLLGVLAGHLNLTEMNTIIERRTGLHRTDDAFLANTSNLFVTQPRFITDPAVLRYGIHTEAIKHCLTGDNGVISAGDYRDVPAIIVYRWLSQRQLCLIVKIDQAEALAPARAFGRTILLIGSLALGVASLLAIGLARTITRPVLALQAGAVRLGRGELEVRLPETSGDELGQLARQFNTMAAALAEKEAQLRRHTEELEQMVEERTAALRESETTFRLLFANHPHPMWVYDLQTLQFLEVNEAAIDHYGYSADEFRSMRLTDIRPPEDIPLLLEDLQRERPALQRSGQWRHRLKDGRIIDVEIASHTLEFVGRKAALVVALDISERKRAEEALRQSEERTRLIIETALDAVVTINPESTIIGWNAQAEVIFGWSRQEVLGQSLDIMLPAQYREAHHRGMKHFLATGEGPVLNRRFEITALRRDGTEFPVELTISPVQSGDSFIFSAFIRDITERKQAEVALRKSEERFSKAFYSSPASMAIARQSDGSYIEVNESFLRLVEYGREEVIGHTSLELNLIDAEGRAEIMRQVRQHGVMHNIEVQAKTKSGRRLNVLTSIENIDLAGEACTITTMLDITERKQAEEQFRLTVEASPSAMILVDMAGKISLVNQRAETLFGYGREDLLDQPIEMLVPSRLRAHHNDYRDTFFSAPTTRPMGAGRDLFGLRKDGSHVPVEIGLNPITTAEGSFVLASIIDITERKRAEEEIAESLRREQIARLEAEAAQQRLAFLVEASNTLASSLDYHATLAAVAQLAVPRIADWCAVDVVEPDGSLQRVAVVHTDPAKVALAYELQRRYPPDPDAPRGVYQVIRTGQAEFYPEISEAVLEAAALDEEQLDLISELGLKSAITMPILARDRVFGVITFVAAESGRRYSEADLALTEELAGRAALAVDNARLYHEAQRLNVTLEERVKERTARLRATNQELEREIAERKRTEEELALERNLLRTLIDNLPDYIYVKDTESRFMINNLAHTRLLGATRPEELVGKTDFDTFPHELAAQYYADEQALIQSGQPLIDREQPTVDRRTGEKKWALSTKVPLRDSQGEVIGLVGLTRDITERKQVEEELRRRRQELQDHIDSMSTLSAKVALDGTLLLVNKIAQQASGLPMETLMQTNFLEGQWWAFDPEVQTRVRQAFQQACAGTSVNYEEQIFVFGQVLIISFSLVPVNGPDGRVAYIVAEARDITPLKQAEEALKARGAQLEAANKELEAFAYSVSHDLRAPLRSIDGFSQALLEDYGDSLEAEAQRYLHRVRAASQRMAELIDDLLTLSRLARREMRLETVDLSVLAQAIVEALCQAEPARQVKFDITPDVTVKADAQLMRVALENLLGNAWKFTAKHPRACIEFGVLLQPDDQPAYLVRDDGAGFDMAYVDKLFGAFQRLHTPAEFSGTGIGLATVQRIIHRHGGHIWAEGAVDKGATFYFTL